MKLKERGESLYKLQQQGGPRLALADQLEQVESGNGEPEVAEMASDYPASGPIGENELTEAFTVIRATPEKIAQYDREAGATRLKLEKAKAQALQNLLEQGKDPESARILINQDREVMILTACYNTAKNRLDFFTNTYQSAMAMLSVYSITKGR